MSWRCESWTTRSLSSPAAQRESDWRRQSSSSRRAHSCLSWAVAKDELDAAVKAIGVRSFGVRGDVTKLRDLDRLYDTIKTKKGRIDIVLPTPAFWTEPPWETSLEEHFAKLIDTNVKGTLFAVQKALPLLKDGGSIILTGSVAGLQGNRCPGRIRSHEGALRSFVRTWTVELKDRHIRSNVVSLVRVGTAPVTDQPAEIIDRMVSTIPMGRMGEPEEIAKAVLYLASDHSSL